MGGTGISPELIDIIGKWAVTIFGIVGTLAVSLVILLARRVYSSIELLFKMAGDQKEEINNIKLFLVHIASTHPESKYLFELLFKAKEKS